MRVTETPLPPKRHCPSLRTPSLERIANTFPSPFFGSSSESAPYSPARASAQVRSELLKRGFGFASTRLPAATSAGGAKLPFAAPTRLPRPVTPHISSCVVYQPLEWPWSDCATRFARGSPLASAGNRSSNVESISPRARRSE